MPVIDQGAAPGRYQVIPRALIFILRGQDVLLMKGAPTRRLWAGKYNGIGGHIERGEDPLSGARRELLEESGLDLPALDLCGMVVIDADPERGVMLFVFRAELPAGRPVSLVESAEGSLEWVPQEQVAALPAVEDLPVLLPRVLAWRPGAAPFFARSRYVGGRLVVSFADGA